MRARCSARWNSGGAVSPTTGNGTGPSGGFMKALRGQRMLFRGNERNSAALLCVRQHARAGRASAPLSPARQRQISASGGRLRLMSRSERVGLGNGLRRVVVLRVLVVVILRQRSINEVQD